ncbi:MAG: hypothetical protein ABI741_16280 [Ferruginibacter sp.]
MRSKLFFVGAILFACIFFSFNVKDNKQKVKDYFTVPGPVDFNKTMYSLSWSSHPNNDYYKQEYLPANERSETFNKMIMIEALVSSMTPKEAAMAKIKELDQRKKIDPVTNYQFIENPATGEYVVDFVISSNDIVEWNAYRYINLKNKSSENGLMLFAYSKRSYGAASTNFLKSLKTERVKDINAVATYKIPGIKLKP